MSGVRGMAKMIFSECGAWTVDARPGVLCEKNDDRLHRCVLGRVDEAGHPHPGLHWCACRYEWSEEQVLDVRPARLQVVELKSDDVLVLETEGQFSDAQLETLHRQLRERFGHDVRAVVLERMSLAGVLRTEASWLEAVGETEKAQTDVVGDLTAIHDWHGRRRAGGAASGEIMPVENAVWLMAGGYGSGPPWGVLRGRWNVVRTAMTQAAREGVTECSVDDAADLYKRGNMHIITKGNDGG